MKVVNKCNRMNGTVNPRLSKLHLFKPSIIRTTKLMHFGVHIIETYCLNIVTNGVSIIEGLCVNSSSSVSNQSKFKKKNGWILMKMS